MYVMKFNKNVMNMCFKRILIIPQILLQKFNEKKWLVTKRPDIN